MGGSSKDLSPKRSKGGGGDEPLETEHRGLIGDDDSDERNRQLATGLKEKNGPGRKNILFDSISKLPKM
jgi:hypothetical protein